MKIGIVGLGLIGGSLGLDLVARGHEVIGVSRKPSTCNTALERGAVTRAGTELTILDDGCDLIVICTPIQAILPTLEKIIALLSSPCVITDVGSVKGAVVYRATELCPYFVGSHPMAGSALQGIDAAMANLFENAPCVVTPISQTSPQALQKVSAFWQSLGCLIYNTTPELHDQAVAWVSHLPVMVSANLIYSCLQESRPELLQLAKALASSGFRDTSRVGGGNVELGLMMAQYNRESLLACLRQYQENLEYLIGQIEEENWDNVRAFLSLCQQQRPDFL
ncbi:MAG: prephenate/arogenate dehydrogenase [Geminocystis sp.]|nr:prephenate/arogenate dehydrogenase [Geminocystis sp.]MCS7147565.1 prephenate/arogenate dehydrogenase [Geminocystis sp.]MDW8115258.1 prephenate/arogenate dehydrogenase [Geminocystis sp.]MDW8464525.1 prephenate/arogenate dehydrogenase [Geminocystis sp.]